MKCKDCTVYYCQYRTTDAEKDCYYEQWEQWTAKEFDWKSFRAETAKDILCAMINHFGTKDNLEDIKFSILCADRLIAKLKENEEG